MSDRERHEDRSRRLLDAMSRPMLRTIARAAGGDVQPSARKHELIERLVLARAEDLERALVELAVRDLQKLCARFGYAGDGGAVELASRLVAVIEEPPPRPPRWRPFAEARAFARGLQLRSQTEWFKLARRKSSATRKLPSDIPTAPNAAYAREGWTNWGDFLGTDNPARRSIEYRPFEQARAYVRALGLANATEWRAYCRKKVGNRRLLPPDIPAAPDRQYVDQGWVSFGDWVGNDHVHASKIEYRTYEEACAFVRTLGIRNEPEWRAYCRGELHPSTPRPLDIPSNPHRTYKHRGWTTWGEFLGTGNVALYKRTFKSFAAARAYVRSLRLVDSKEWRRWCAAGKRPPDIPGAPDLVYRDQGWISWPDFLGNGNDDRARIKRRA